MSWPCRRSRSSTPPRPTSRSAGTQRVCASAWRDFNGFCGEHGLDPLPASPLTVVRYLSHLAKLGRSVSTIDLRTAAIALAHRMAGHDAPTVRDEVRQVLAGIRNTHGRAKLPPKVVDPELLTPEHRIWRAAVFANAGGRCQWLEGCEKSAPRYRMFADHIVERKDGGAPYDPANGQCLCGQHHPLKTARERARRQAERS